MSDRPFGESLRDLILSRFASLRKFAQEIDMGPEYLSRIVNGHVGRPEDETLARMADALGVSVSYLRALDKERPSVEVGIVGPRVVVIQGPNGEQEVPIERVVAYVEGFPNPRHQARLERWRAKHEPATYQRLCARIFVAWSSNYELFLDTLDVADVR
jgi:transcriptional regulator with XRE-family HTH domain